MPPSFIVTYRKLIDQIKNKTLDEKEVRYALDILNRSANRDSSPQFYDGLPTEKEQYFLGRQEISNQDFLGLVLDYDEEEKMVLLEQRNYFKVGDQIEFFSPHHENVLIEVKEIYNEDRESVEVANHPMEILYLKCEQPLSEFDMGRKVLTNEK